MALIVKKFGGSSVATPERIQQVAQRILREQGAHDQVVVVVSAMGDTTDNLLTLAGQVTPDLYGREMDLLLATGEQVSIALLTMALRHLGARAMAFTGIQAGIVTDGGFNKARIVDIRPARVRQALAAGSIAVVAGFQGYTDDGDITTLGRGGSDTTAVALAGALHADVCEIYTDVAGVYSADPRLVPAARKIPRITYNEMLEMARLGAVVMQPRAVEAGMSCGVPIHVRSTFSSEQGTIIQEEAADMEEKEYVVRGVTHDADVAKVAVLGVPDRPGVAYKLFAALAAARIDVDMIVQSIRNTDKNINDIVFTVSKADLPQVRSIVSQTGEALGALGVVVEENVAKVSVVGAGMLGNPGIAAAVFGALADAGINIEVISTSEISISCLIQAERGREAVNAIHNRFFPPLKS